MSDFSAILKLVLQCLTVLKCLNGRLSHGLVNILIVRTGNIISEVEGMVRRGTTVEGV